ncbi:hypothetical protein AVEN_179350-1 [Araneus ventricosus]|uniref:Uncharacterized protein n=1 Tax=Araneus ventricosus TaxID=182803 RepID=A0A4Y2H238_ARAVE|nr:hypothetical protein AVEN_179350-1 [Araneus ventricosus]
MYVKTVTRTETGRELKSSLELEAEAEDKWVKLLGLLWSPWRDMLKLNISTFKSVTLKRELLSAIASIFDPLGILSHFTIRLKIMLRGLWRNNVSWDDPIPNTILTSWEEFVSQAELLKSTEIPRFLKDRLSD